MLSRNTLLRDVFDMDVEDEGSERIDHAGHKPSEITMPRCWIVKVAPWLKLCLRAWKGFANLHGHPFPIPNVGFFFSNISNMKC